MDTLVSKISLQAHFPWNGCWYMLVEQHLGKRDLERIVIWHLKQMLSQTSQLNHLSFLTQAHFRHILHWLSKTTNNEQPHYCVYAYIHMYIYIYITQKKNNIKQLLYKPINTPSSSTHCSTSCHQVFQTTVSASSSAGPFDKRAQSSGEHLRRGGLDKNLGDLHLRSDQNPPNHSFWLVNRDPYIVLL